jgi:hypothetical protein
MPVLAPINLDKTSRTSGKLPDGRIVPLAFDLTTQELLMKTSDGMPWGDDAALDAVLSAGGRYVNDPEVWFRGVWEPAPAQVLDAEYTAKQQGNAPTPRI